MTRFARLRIVVVLAIATSACGRNAQPPTCVVRFEIPPPSGARFSSDQVPALSPDGSRVAFTATGADGTPRLWVRSLRRSEGRPMPGTEGATMPFWSPDGENLGFFAEDRLKRAGLRTGVVKALCDAHDARGGSWSTKGDIVFSAARGHAIFSVPSTGGAVRQLTNLENKPDANHLSPSFLPDGEHFLYSSHVNDLLVGSLRSSEHVYLSWGTSPTYISPGFLVFTYKHFLLRIRFSLERLETDGPTALVASGVVQGHGEMTEYSVSSDGSVVVYGRARTEMVWLDSTGREMGQIPDPVAYQYLSISPSGKQVLASLEVPGSSTILYVYETSTDQWRRVADEIDPVGRALWTADETRIIFTARRGETTHVFEARADGNGPVRKLFDIGRLAYVAAISDRGDLMALVDYSKSPRTQFEFRVVSVASGTKKEGKTVWERKTAWNEFSPAFSPDGRWLAFVSTESGREEVYVSDLGSQAGPTRVSVNGGSLPAWSGNGRELTYQRLSAMGNGRELIYQSLLGMVAVSTDGPPFTWGARQRRLFRPTDRELVAFSPDGTRFLALNAPRPDRPSQLMGLVACGGTGIPAIFP